MSSDVIHFSCQACQHQLTVPAHLAGISGPCPVCGSTVTSPAAPAAAPAPAFSGFGSPPPAPAEQPSLPPMPAPSIQPIPGAPTGGLGGLGGFTGSAPPPLPPAWQMPGSQSPGLGQTLLDSTKPATMLPPRRPDSQLPVMGDAPAAAPAWGGGAGSPQLPPMEPPPARSGSHSSLIPGSPSFGAPPAMGMTAGDGGQGSLLSRSVPSSPLAAQPPPLNLPAQDGQTRAPAGRSRPLPRPRRGSNVFMIGLSVIFLGGFLAAVGWLFQEPLRQVVQRFTGGQEAAEAAPTLPTPDLPGITPEIPAKDAEKPQPAVADTPAPGGGRFDPMEPSQPAGPAVAAVPAPTPSPAKPEVAAIPAPEMVAKPPALPEAREMPTPSGAEGPLVEVTATPVKNAASKLSTTPEPPADLQLGSGTQIRMDGVTPDAKPAADALLAFLKAGSLEERLRHSLAPEVMRPYMERYYAANPDGPILVDAIALVRHDPKPQIGGGAHAVFGVESKTWEYALPVMLEQQQGRFKVDWLSFVEFKDRLLEKFLQGYQEGTARFHVGITRTHYFEDKVPNSSSKDAFRLSPAPPNPFTATVFVDKESDVGRDLRDKIPWGSQVWAIVELEWIKLGNLSWVQLTGVPQLNWYSVPAEAAAKRALPMTDGGQVPTETQKAVPVGRGAR